MRKRLRSFLFLMILLAPLLLFLPAGAEEAPVRVGFFAFDGFNVVREDGSLTGYGYDYLMEIAKYNGWSYEFVTEAGGVPLTYDRAMALLLDGRLDIIGTVRKNAEREKTLYFPDLAAGTNNGILTVRRSNTHVTIDDMTTLQGLHIGLLRGSSRNAEINRFAATNSLHFTYSKYASVQAMTRALNESQEVDALYTSSLRATENERVVFSQYFSDFYFVCPLSNRRLSRQLNEGVGQLALNQPGFASALYLKYYGDTSAYRLVLTEAEQQYVRTNPTLRVAVDAATPPLESYNEKTGEYTGIVADVLALLESSTGLRFVYTAEPYQDALQQVTDGEADLLARIVGDNPWAEQHGVDLSVAYMDVSVSAIVNTRVHDLDEEQLIVAVQDGSYTKTLVARMYPNCTFSLFSSQEECVRAVNEGRADVTYLPTVCTDYYSAKKLYTHIRTLSASKLNHTFCLGVSKQCDRTLYRLLNRAISALTQEQLLDIQNNNSLLGNENPGLTGYIYQNPVQAALLGMLMLLAIGGAVGGMVYMRHERRKEQALSEQRITLALSKTHIGVWDYDFLQQRILATKGCYDLASKPEWTNDVPASLVSASIVPTEDGKAFFALFDELRDGKTSASAVLHLRLPGAGGQLPPSPSWIRVTITTLSTRMGHPWRAVLVLEDATDEMLSRQELTKMTEFQRMATQNALATYEIDLTADTMLSINEPEVSMISKYHTTSYNELVEKIGRNYVLAEDADGFFAFLSRDYLFKAAANHQRELSFECRMRRSRSAGDYFWVSFSLYIMLEAVAGHVCLSLILYNVDAQKKEQALLQHRATSDSLTHLLNREALTTRGQLALESCVQAGDHAALMLLDVDNFKGANDTGGHDFGDRVLQRVAAVLSSTFRHFDLVGRLGGDEFMVLMLHYTQRTFVLQKASELSRRLRFTQDGVAISCSIGIAVLPEHGTEFSDLYKKADQALYQAKNAGKSQFMLWKPVGEATQVEQTDGETHADE